jgi:oxygen-independent coproporphyrinogen-3 oxidase
MGFGPGAHSCVSDVRYSYISDLEEYISGVLGEKNIIDEYEEIGLLDRASEYLMLGMRMTAGISAEEYNSTYRRDFEPIEYMLREFEKKGWAKLTDGRWSFTTSGFLLSNILIGALLEAQAQNKLSGNPWINETLYDDTPQVELPDGSHAFV